MLWWQYCLIGWALWVAACLEWFWYEIENAPEERYPGEFGAVD